MKKFVLALVVGCASLLGSAYADDLKVSEPDIWPVLYHGNWSLAHKMMLMRPVESTNDQIMNSFMMAYVAYRNGDTKTAENMFRDIDYMVEHYYLPASGE